MHEIILASQSPRRKQLLEWAEIPFTVFVSHADENYPEGLRPEDVAMHIAFEKAKVVSAKHPGKLILAADTIVVMGNDIIGKPADRTDAIHILSRLNGNTHRVITGVVLYDGEKQLKFSDTTSVSFNELTSKDIEFYVDKYHPYDKAGAYAIQEWIGVVGIRRIEGDFYNVMGLPVSRVVQALANW